ncbi:hypothetical protein H696_04181 [Fonticula alba]|uniref:Peptidase S8/S53 domain-containing protein n=1 Tax=Fonticula alba TaxID=691883 RepID=A0A058Z8A3_FONAL|nr:hypothetical protein H696_04181 [Fonticula alba]KCV69772.1 hypothetical protein H696_04181 [Fonticula alba]|eukprot:XP_009496337.1 hypothetical protein H696_04181 [Fonticula alba]
MANVHHDAEPEHLPVPLIHNADAETIPDQYVVVFRPDISVAEARVFADSLDIGRFVHIGSQFKAVSGRMTAGMLRRVRTRPDLVQYVEPDQVVRVGAITQPNAPWGLDRVDQRNIPLDTQFSYYNHGGSGVNVYVLDTGINHAHIDFGGHASHGYNFHDNNGNANDDNGHGTHCAGTIGSYTWGVAKNAALISVRVLGTSGAGVMSNVIAGVAWVAERHKQAFRKKTIASMSLESEAYAALDEAVAAAINAGVAVIAAAGNSNRDACLSSPARVSSAITVAATDKYDNRASFSNWGSCVDIFAPGVAITSTWIGSTTATATLSGTSMAAPHVAGVAALALGQGGALTPASLKNTLLRNATPNVVKDPRGSPNRMVFAPFN